MLFQAKNGFALEYVRIGTKSNICACFIEHFICHECEYAITFLSQPECLFYQAKVDSIALQEGTLPADCAATRKASPKWLCRTEFEGIGPTDRFHRNTSGTSNQTKRKGEGAVNRSATVNRPVTCDLEEAGHQVRFLTSGAGF